MIKRLREIAAALDDYLSDTDPMFDEDMTDEEVRAEDPVFWACKEINSLLQELDAGG